MTPALILASGSTARAKLLREMGIPFRVVVSGIDETEIPGEAPDAQAARLARLKAEAVAARVGAGIVLGADSLVVLPSEIPDSGSRIPDSEVAPCDIRGPGIRDAGSEIRNPYRILGKPRDHADAAAMLRLQMGRTTAVITAVCLIDAAGGRRAEGVDRSEVRLNPMSDREIEAYAAAPRVLTSAGGYLLEDEHDPHVSLVSGELGTVLGLPVAMTRRLLGELAGAPPGAGPARPQ
jgi:septum formation protein